MTFTSVEGNQLCWVVKDLQFCLRRDSCRGLGSQTKHVCHVSTVEYQLVCSCLLECYTSIFHIAWWKQRSLVFYCQLVICLCQTDDIFARIIKTLMSLWLMTYCMLKAHFHFIIYFFLKTVGESWFFLFTAHAQIRPSEKFQSVIYLIRKKNKLAFFSYMYFVHALKRKRRAW